MDEIENKARLAFGTRPAWRLNELPFGHSDASIKHRCSFFCYPSALVLICHRADLDAIGCSAARLSYLFRLGKCSSLSSPRLHQLSKANAVVALIV